MTTLPDIVAMARANALFISGLTHPEPSGALPGWTRTIVLLSPDEPAFWPYFQGSPEYRDGQSHPMDRWSKRVIQPMASAVNGLALFPSDGPPYPSFIAWAKGSGRSHASPTGLLVHDSSGLFISYRGAIALPEKLPLPGPASSPCQSCAAPCVTACPVDAFETGQYDVTRCKSHLETDAGSNCRLEGCLLRRACPVGTDKRLAEQSAFHMKAFHPDAF